jgi:gamma-glutamylcyclotransferase (GGCT)/AIG2-like uncharacterized protein YtfP
MADLEKDNLFFVYGSLMSGCERSAFLDRDHKVRFIGKATTSGVLYELGSLVGLIDDQSSGTVHGELYEIIDMETFFATLDIIEGYWPQQPQRSLYVRKQISVRTAEGAVLAWAYIYNQPVNGFSPVASGDYRRRDVAVTSEQ